MPFHPDESTQIFMSSDIDLILSGHLTDLFYNENPIDNDKQSYRLLDAPFTRYIIGIARLIFNQPQLDTEWNWSENWQQNQAALPSNSILLISRLSVASLFPFTLLLFYFLWKHIFNQKIAFIGTFLFASNSIVLLHSRRAMSESGLLFFLGLSLIAIFKLPKKYLFLSAIPIALGINCKISLIPLLLIALFLIVYQLRDNHWKKIIFSISLFASVLIVITYILNPVMWQEPLKVGKIMVSKRSILTQNQIKAIGTDSPDFILNQPGEKIVGLIAQSFITKPAIQDIANYQNELKNQTNDYLSYFYYSGIGRFLIPGILYMMLMMIGIFTPSKQNLLSVMLKISLVLFIIEILISFEIPFQRYYLPLYPFISVFAFYGAFRIWNNIREKIFKSSQSSQ